MLEAGLLLSWRRRRILMKIFDEGYDEGREEEVVGERRLRC
jgi:hypothetical protein